LPSPFCTFTVREEDILPLDALLTGDDILSIVVRRVSPSQFMVIPKYKVAGGGKAGPWRFARLNLSRLLKTYSPKSVWEAVEASGIRTVWSPSFSSVIPVASTYDIKMHCGIRPGGYVEHISYLARLSKDIVDMLDILSPLGSCLRFTGSILHGSFVEGFSDVDIVIDASSRLCLEKLYELIPLLSKYEISAELKKAYILREASARGIDASIIASIYRGWSRLSVGSVQASITIIDSSKRMATPRFVLKISRSSPVRRRVTVKPLAQSLGDFPALVETEEGIALLVYDGIYIPSLLEGGVFEVYGLQGDYINFKDHRKVLVVGVSEKTTYIKCLKRFQP
jgi:hypothetical protein